MGSQKTFSKPPLSIDDQLTLLKNRGLNILDEAKAKHRLETVGYYRFSGYFAPFQTSNHRPHLFQENTTFERIWDVYVFDRELRLIFLDLLERIEIALRSAMTNHLSQKYGPLWYLSEECFSTKWIAVSQKSKKSPRDYFINEIKGICQEKKEEFIKHYYTHYDQPPYPPSWMIMECLSFGKCTSLFRHLAKVSDKAAISKVFGYHPKVIESCLESLRYTRNICAHHSRLWNRWFVLISKHMHAFGNVPTRPRSLHQQLVIIEHLHESISPHSQWKTRLFELLIKHQTSLPFHLMGFQKDWQNDPFWKL